MTKNEMEKLKRDGLIEHLRKECGSKLWKAKLAIDNAQKNCLENFQKEIDKAQEAITDAEQLWAESKSL